MRYVGVDLAWKDVEGRRRTAVATMDDLGRLEAIEAAGSDDEITERILAAGRPALVGIDAPLHIPNQGGSRPCERELIRAGIPVFAANRSFFDRHYGGRRGEVLTGRLQRMGYEFTDGRGTPPRGDAVIEVYPHTFWRSVHETVPPYKKGRRAVRVVAVREVRIALLNMLPAQPTDKAMEALGPADLSGLGRGELDRLGDALDATAAALTMYTLAVKGEGPDGPTRVFGDLERGYILASWPPRTWRRTGK